jgi:hypothetical protein
LHCEFNLDRIEGRVLENLEADTIGPPPVVGTWRILRPAASRNIANGTWVMLYGPDDENDISPLRALAAAMNSAIDLTGFSTCTVIVSGSALNKASGASCSSLYGESMP